MTQDEKTARPGRGIFWMVVTGLLFVSMTALVKAMGTRIPAPEAAFLRYALGLVFLLPMIPAMMRAPMTKRLWGIFVARGAVHTIGVSLWFFAMARIPLADVTAMGYLSPVFVTVGAALFLGERLALRRLLAVLAALVGALIVLRPGFRDIGPGHIALLINAVMFGTSYLLAKQATNAVSPAVVVGMLSLTVTIGLAPLALVDWIPPTMNEVLILFAVACVATAGHYTMMLAFQSAPLVMTQPATFLQLIWAVSMGALLFGEAVDPFVVLGGLVIVFAVSFISWREMVLKRRSLTPAPFSTKG